MGCGVTGMRIGYGRVDSGGVSDTIHTHKNERENNMEWAFIIALLAIIIDG